MAWSAADVRGTLASIDEWWDLLTAGAPPAAVAQLEPPAPSSADQVGAESAVAALSRAGRRLHALGHGVPPQRGVLAGIFISEGGVPKLPVADAEVDIAGVVGDRQAKRRYHGRVWQALSLWSAEVVERLHAEGHPLQPGGAGENLSLRGLEWATLRPGARLRIGAVLAEISMPVTPCRQIAGCFADGKPWRIGHRRERGVTRWYASVLEPGPVVVGDVVEVEP